MAVTMRDVAQLAGVSQRTVSNVVNDYVHVKPATRERVQDAIAQLRYRPNISAQNLRHGRTGLFALALPEIDGYFAEIAELLQRYAKERGITLLVDLTGGDRQRELLVLEGYRSSLIDGLILDPLAVTPGDLEQSEPDIPIVLLGERIEESRFLHVSIDNVAAARAATEHLLERGRRRIAVVGAVGSRHPPGPGPASRRFEGFAGAMAAAGLGVLDQHVPRTDGWTRAAGHAATLGLLDGDETPDAIFCFNDLLAVGTLKALSERGIRTPDDVAVVGWDDIGEAAYTTPALTTIAPDKEAIARAAIDGLFAQIEGGVADRRPARPGYQLTIRRST